MRFFEPTAVTNNKGSFVVPALNVLGSGLLVHSGNFCAFWDERRGIWSTSEQELASYIDDVLLRYSDAMAIQPRLCNDFTSGTWKLIQDFIRNFPDSYIPMDQKVHFKDEQLRLQDYASKTLPYSLSDEPCPNYDRLMSTLYNEVDRRRLEWGIGCALLGKNFEIQKMFVIYGEPGSGKSTVLDIIRSLFEGYCKDVNITSVVRGDNRFCLQQFLDNPVVGLQAEVDLSKVATNEVLNSIVAHDPVSAEKKYENSVNIRIQTLLFLASNKKVQITDAWSGLLRRLVIIEPSGRRLPRDEYEQVRRNLQFELGSIAKHCMDIYLQEGMKYLDSYRPEEMADQTDYFRTFVLDNLEYFTSGEIDGKDAYRLYKIYMEENGYGYAKNISQFRTELKKYFHKYISDTITNGRRRKHVYSDFIEEKALAETASERHAIHLEEQPSKLDNLLATYPAQYANSNGTPFESWHNVKRTLSDLDTHRCHYVRPPINHIVIDFDLKDSDGNKSLSRNLEAAETFPPTYTEISQGGQGLHLHYIYTGNPLELSSLYSEGIEVKVFKGKSALRRKLSKCNDLDILSISSGLPLKGAKPMLDDNRVLSERQIRTRILRCLRKEVHPDTTSNIHFIAKTLNDAYLGTEPYDVSDLEPSVIQFAAQSTNQSAHCLEEVAKMHFKSDAPSENADTKIVPDRELVFFDVEVFPNLFVICWKKYGEEKVYSIRNPDQKFLETWLKQPLVGFNNRRYDNHIVYARYLGYTNEELFKLSQRIVTAKKGDQGGFFNEAFNLSYTDVYDFASAGHKQSLKKWEIELGIHHMENEYPWDQPVPEEAWSQIENYCSNDVRATEAVFDYIHADYVARVILSRMSGLSPNDTTNQQTIRIVFGSEKKPQLKLKYIDLSRQFPGYKFEAGKSTYRGYEVGEGGFVYSVPGYYENAACIDVASMHPTSIEQIGYLGEFADNYSNLKKARVAIKHKDLDALGRILSPEIADLVKGGTVGLKDLSNALKTALNSAYGLTAAHFDNPFRHPDNIDNIVAKRGALFMIDLLEFCKEKGWKVFHIKTDSIKIADCTPDIEKEVMKFGERYGYVFEIEERFKKICLVNKAVYIALEEDGDGGVHWTATGAQFAHPYIFKKLFTGEELEAKDYYETKSVSGDSAMYLHILGDNSEAGYQFIGRVGSFVPVLGDIGRELLVKRNDKYSFVAGTKDWLWIPSDWLRPGVEIDMSYYEALIRDALFTIEEFVPFEVLKTAS